MDSDIAAPRGRCLDPNTWSFVDLVEYAQRIGADESVLYLLDWLPTFTGHSLIYWNFYGLDMYEDDKDTIFVERSRIIDNAIMHVNLCPR